MVPLELETTGIKGGFHRSVCTYRTERFCLASHFGRTGHLRISPRRTRKIEFSKVTNYNGLEHPIIVSVPPPTR